MVLLKVLDMSYLYIFGTILFTIYGQLILKWRIVKYGQLPELLTQKLIFLLKLLTDPFILSGFISAFVASLFWMAAMTKMDLSHAYPIIVGGLAIFTSFAAVILFRESFSVYKVTGLMLIVLGIYFINKV